MKTPGILRAGILPGIAGALVIGTLAICVWYGYAAVVSQPIQRVVFAGNVERLAREDLEALAQTVKATTSIAAVRDAAKRLPWVREASVRRLYPDAVEITFETHGVVARWGESALVSSRGEVFTAPYDRKLPRFRGPESAAVAMANEYPAIATAVVPLGSPVSELRVSARGGWQLALESGLVLELGRGDLQARLVRFAAAWPNLAAQGVDAAHVDLRHANGFAIRRAAPLAVTKPAARSANRKPQER